MKILACRTQASTLAKIFLRAAVWSRENYLQCSSHSEPALGYRQIADLHNASISLYCICLSEIAPTMYV